MRSRRRGAWSAPSCCPPASRALRRPGWFPASRRPTACAEPPPGTGRRLFRFRRTDPCRTDPSRTPSGQRIRGAHTGENTTPHGPPPGPGTPAADAGVTASTWPDGAWGTTTGPANVAPTSPAPGLRIRMNSARRWSVRNGPTAGPAPRGRLRAQPRAGVVHHPGTSPSGQGTGLQNRQRGFESLRPCGAMV
jgi:hypothetical protein